MAGAADWFFTNTGSPICLQVGGKLATGSGVFRIDGLPAVVLARTSWAVILRDPRPMAGLRTVESQGYSITIPFIDVQLKLRKPSSSGHNALDIRVYGGDLLVFPVVLAVYNFNRQTVNLRCGKSYRDGRDLDEIRWIHLAREKTGVFTATCKVHFRQEGHVNLDAKVYQHPPFITLRRPFPTRMRPAEFVVPPPMRRSPPTAPCGSDGGSGIGLVLSRRLPA